MTSEPRARAWPAVIVLATLVQLVGVSSTAVAVEAGGDLCTLGPRGTGTAASELIIGTPGDDALTGAGGDDLILGCGGNDTLTGGPGDDRLVGGPGNDSLSGGAGSDIFSGGFRTYDRYFEPPLAIPCCGAANSVSITFDVDPQEIRSIQVRLDIEHASPADLKVQLSSPVSPFAGGDPTLTDRNCAGASVSTNRCGPGQFHNAASVETGVVFTSDASTTISASRAVGKNLNGMFHPLGTLDTPFRFQPSCGTSGTDCAYTLTITDVADNGIDGVIHYAAIDLEVPGVANGSDNIVGGTGGGDLATYVERDATITYTGADNVANDGAARELDNVHSDVEWVYGGAGNDTLSGTAGRNDLRGMLGRDTVNGLDGDDVLDLHATWGADRLSGGGGNDSLDGRAATAEDVMDGGDGTDRCLNPRRSTNCETFA